MSPPNNLLIRRCAIGSLGSVLVFILLVLTLRILNPQMSPVSVPISLYVTGHDGFLMTIAFLARGLGELFLVLGLFLGTTRSGRSRMGLTLLILAVICTFLVALFPGLVAPFAPGGLQNTTALRIHSLSAFLGFTSLGLTAIFWSRSLRRDSRWGSSTLASLLLGILMLLSMIGLFVFSQGFTGFAERVLEVWIVTWLGLMAWRLIVQSQIARRAPRVLPKILS